MVNYDDKVPDLSHVKLVSREGECFDNEPAVSLVEGMVG